MKTISNLHQDDTKSLPKISVLNSLILFLKENNSKKYADNLKLNIVQLNKYWKSEEEKNRNTEDK